MATRRTAAGRETRMTTAMQWIVEQSRRTQWLPGTPEPAIETVMRHADKVWRSADEFARMTRRSKTHCAKLLREAIRAGKVECLPARGNIPAQYRKCPTQTR